MDIVDPLKHRKRDWDFLLLFEYNFIPAKLLCLHDKKITEEDRNEDERESKLTSFIKQANQIIKMIFSKYYHCVLYS